MRDNVRGGGEGIMCIQTDPYMYNASLGHYLTRKDLALFFCLLL